MTRIKQTGFLNSSVQRVLLEALNDEGFNRLPSFDGETLTLSRLFGGTTSFVFSGRNLTVTDGAVSGKVTGLTINELGTGEVLKATSLDIRIGDLFEKAGAVPTGSFSGEAYFDYIATLTGGPLTHTGSRGRDVLEASGDAPATLKGGKANDVFILNPTDEFLSGDIPKPLVIRGGKGNKDLLVMERDDIPTIIDLREGNVRTENGKIFATLDSVENARGGTKGDRIFGSSDDNQIFGNRGNDTLRGGKGNDKISGGAGKDTIYGDPGSDILSGGKGTDTFVFTNIEGRDFEGRDTITDFEASLDKIRLRGRPEDPVFSQEDGNTIIEYSNGTIVIEGQLLDREDIMLIF